MADTSVVKQLYKDQITWAIAAYGSDKLTDEKNMENTLNVFKEEIQELVDANSKEDLLDAVVDIFVVNCQLLAMYSSEDVEVDTKYAEAFGSMYTEAFGSIAVSNYLSKMKAVLNKDCKKSIAVLGFMYLGALMERLHKQGYLLKEAIEEVTASNWSKFPTLKRLKERYGEDLTEEELIDKECRWIEDNTEGCKNVRGVLSDFLPEEGETDPNKRVVVFRRDGGLGKIVKASSYFPPALKQYVN